MEDPEVKRILEEKMRRMANDLSAQKEPIVKLTESNFKQYSAGNKPLFVDFWASWCGPCMIMEPVVERLATKYGDSVLFGKVNVDEEMSLSSRYQVFSIPTFMLFKNGTPVDAVIGAVGEAGLEGLVKKGLNGSSVHK